MWKNAETSAELDLIDIVLDSVVIYHENPLELTSFLFRINLENCVVCKYCVAAVSSPGRSPVSHRTNSRTVRPGCLARDLSGGCWLGGKSLVSAFLVTVR